MGRVQMLVMVKSEEFSACLDPRLRQGIIDLFPKRELQSSGLEIHNSEKLSYFCLRSFVGHVNRVCGGE